MAKPARPVVVAVDFPGILTNVDPRDLSEGAAEVQLNLQSMRYGEVSSRLGCREITFEDE